MAYVNIYYHRERSRLGKHARYIATRPGSTGLHGLGPEFRALRGDVAAAVRLLEQHAAQARTQAGDGTREGPFVRLLFTLPTDLAARVDRSSALLKDGSRLVLRDAIEATFRSAGRELQGVYAIHFHAEKREAHGHVHVDLSPLDLRGRTTFLTAEQRARLRAAWEREVRQALARVERRSPQPAAAQEKRAAHEKETARAQGATTAPVQDAAARRTTPTRRADPSVALPEDAWADDGLSPRRPRRRPTRPASLYMPTVAARLFGFPCSPLGRLLMRALQTRAQRRWRAHRPLLSVRFVLGLPVPRVTVQARSPLVPRPLLRVPFLS